MQSHLAKAFARDGFVGPIPGISAELAGTLAAQLRMSLRADNYGIVSRRNRHLDMEPVREAATSPAILDAIRAVYSPDIALWRSHVFTGTPGRGLGWHSDRFTTLLDDPEDHLTVHLALTAATPGNCMMVIPGSHRWDDAQRLEAGFALIEKTAGSGYGTPYYRRTSEEVRPRAIPLEPGEFFAFHPATLHASVDRLGDRSNDNPVLSFAKRSAKSVLSRLQGSRLVADPPRIAIGFRYCDPRNRIAAEAFGELAGSAQGPVLVAGDRGAQQMEDWRWKMGERTDPARQ